MKTIMPIDLDLDVQAVLSRIASKGTDGHLIDDLIKLDVTLAAPLWEAACLGLLWVRATPGDLFQFVADLHIENAKILVATKGAVAKPSDIALVLLTLYDFYERQDSARYTSRLTLEDIAHLAENCLGAEYEQHLIALRQPARKFDEYELALDRRRTRLNYRIWQEGIDLARSWCETIAKHPELTPHREWLRQLRQDLGDFAKMDPATGAGATLKSMEEFRERLDGWRVLAPPAAPPRTEKLSPEEREREIERLIRECINPTRDFLAKEVGCATGTVSRSPAFQRMLKRQKAEQAGRPRRGGHYKQRPLGSIEPPASPQVEPDFFDDLSDELRQELDRLDAEARRGGS